MIEKIIVKLEPSHNSYLEFVLEDEAEDRIGVYIKTEIFKEDELEHIYVDLKELEKVIEMVKMAYRKS